MSHLYSINDLVDSIIKEYDLKQKDEDDTHQYYQRIYRALKGSNMLKDGFEKINPETKKKHKVFTEQQRQRLLSEKTLYNYVRNNSTSKVFFESQRYDALQKDILQRRNSYFDMLAEPDDPLDDNVDFITDDKFQQQKNNMMLTALFEKFFTPINDDLLRNDMTQTIILKDEAALEIEDIKAEQRLSHPEGNYFKKKEPT